MNAGSASRRAGPLPPEIKQRPHHIFKTSNFGMGPKNV
jgi:hypothetical protein